MNQELRFNITAVTANFTQKFQEAGNQIRTFSEGVESRFKGIRDQLGNLGNLMAAVGAVKLVGLVDEATLVGARLRDVTGSAEGARAAQQTLFASAQRLQVGYTELAGSVAKMLPAVKELGGGTGQAIQLAEILATTSKLSGASAQEASAAQTQFAQALASGVLQGDELKSILENNSALARAMAQGLGVGVGELRRLGAEGKLTADAVSNALLGQYDQILERSAEIPPTVGGAWTQVQNAFQMFLADLNEGTGAFSVVADLLGALARVITTVSTVLKSTGDEATKLGGNTSVVTWGQTVGAIFAVVVDAGRAVWEVIAGMARAIGGLAAAAVTALSGDLTGAGNILKSTWEDAGAAVQRVMTLMSGGEGSALLAYTLNQGGGGGAPAGGGPLTGGGGGASGGKGAKGSKASAEVSQVPMVQAELEAARVAYMQTNALREMSKLEELQALEEIAQRYDLNAKDKARIARDTARLEIAALREMAETGRQLDEQQRVEREQKALAAVALAESEAQNMANMGLITQQQLLEQELQFEQQKTQIKMDAMQARLLAVDPDRDPIQYAQILSQIEQLELQHAMKAGQIKAQAVAQNPVTSVIKSAEMAFNQSIQGMLQGTMSLRQGLASIWQGISSSIIGEISKIIAKRVAMFALEKAQSLGLIGAKAAEAGAGAAASQAGIPIVGPALALGAMATIFAAVMGLSGSIPSAEGGWSIPAGTNPIAQLHEKEMVLPAQYAEMFREMAEGGGSVGGGTVVYNDHSGRLSDEEIRRKSRVIAEEMNKLQRNGWRPA